MLSESEVEHYSLLVLAIANTHRHLLGDKQSGICDISILLLDRAVASATTHKLHSLSWHRSALAHRFV